MSKFYLTALMLLFAYSGNAQKLPYPIIFIHGLNSNSSTWLEMNTDMLSKGLVYGGRIDYCLNFDGNNYVANLNTYPATGADIALFTDYNTELIAGDFYNVNFDISNSGLLPSENGFVDVLSNEAAITKQGRALRYIIEIVMLKTGRNKVVLMGHSMGGLAAREYIQNPINWQSDGQHHVAKLTTTGTPHGGFTGYGLSPGIDFRSEAFRDLKSAYVVSEAPGVYLFGGAENYTVMNNNVLFDFYNVDVNCNGVDADNSSIVGLNQKTLYSNIDYAWIIGLCTDCVISQGSIQGDGVVRATNADLGNFYNLPEPRNKFNYIADATVEIHSDLPEAIFQNYQGLDEPNELSLSYGVGGGQEYKGFITAQPAGGYQFDYDCYAFSLNTSAQVNVSIQNTYSNPLTARFINSSGNVVATTVVPSNLPLTFSHVMPSGTSFLQFYTTPSATSYLSPYTFSLSANLDELDESQKEDSMVYPNPTSSRIYIDTKGVVVTAEIFNMIGQKVWEGDYSSAGVNVESLQSGTYFIKATIGERIINIKFVKE